MKTKKYVYVDWLEPGDHPHQHVEYNQPAWSEQCLHNITALIPTEWARNVGGFDETMVGWEDWDFFAKMAEKGYCGVRLAEPLLYYRQESGSRREKAHAIRSTLLEEIKKKHQGVSLMACSSCGGGAQKIAEQIRQQIDNQQSVPGIGPVAASNNSIKLEFIGEQAGGITFTVNGRQYTGASTPENRYVNALPEDVDMLVMRGVWRQVYA